LAVRNSREIAVLEQAIALQKKKLWTSWLNADGLNPLAIGLRIARNIAGGGDRAALKLEIARLELRHAELTKSLCQAVTQAMLAHEKAFAQHALAQDRLATHQARVQLVEVAYRLGEGSTEAMWQLWLTQEELQAQLAAAEQQTRQAKDDLTRLIFPAP
jgi:multidrug resistance efflux pump